MPTSKVSDAVNIKGTVRSVEIGAPASKRSASRTGVDGSTDPRALEILQELRSKRRESTPRLFPVADCKADGEI